METRFASEFVTNVLGLNWLLIALAAVDLVMTTAAIWTSIMVKRHVVATLSMRAAKLWFGSALVSLCWIATWWWINMWSASTRVAVFMFIAGTLAVPAQVGNGVSRWPINGRRSAT